MSGAESFPRSYEGSLVILTEDQIRGARLTVCRQAKNVKDAEFLMDLLGIHPLQEDLKGIEERGKLNKLYRKRMNRSIFEKRRKNLPLNEEELAYLEWKDTRSA